MVGLAIAVGVLVMVAFFAGFLLGYYVGRAPLVPPTTDADVNNEPEERFI